MRRVARGIGIVAVGLLTQVATGRAEAPTAAPNPSVVVCGERAVVVNQLGQQFLERPIGRGISEQGNVLELLVSRTTGSWTIIESTPKGLSCVVQSGDNWDANLQTAGRPPK